MKNSPYMKNSGVKLAWGMLLSGEMRHVSEVKNGKGCACVCSECEQPLIANQGKIKTHYFSHQTDTNCSGESTLHRAAKQILEEAAQRKMCLSLPSLNGAVSKIDIIGMEHHQKWSANDKDIAMACAQQEVSFNNRSLIADVLVTTSAGKKIAVEIYVKHKKEDLEKEKYKRLEQEAIEINLSDLAWDSDRLTITHAVLTSASRYWLYTNGGIVSKAHAIKYLSTIITNKNIAYTREFNQIISNLKKTKAMNSQYLNWPTLKEIAHGKDSLGNNVYGQASKKPKITSLLDNTWLEVCGGWKTKGLVNNKIEIDVYFLLAGNSQEDYLWKEPTLVAWFSPPRNTFFLEWKNIRHWQEKIKIKAHNNLNKKLLFSYTFYSWSDFRKWSYLAKEFDIPYNEWVLQVDAERKQGWNASEGIWKSLVWYYEIVPRQGGTVDIGEILTSELIEGYLQCSVSQVSQDNRIFDLWHWFDFLVKKKFLKPLKQQQFLVSKQLPASFIPWKSVNGHKK